MKWARLVIVAAVLVFTAAVTNAQTTNRWATGVPGKWELATNWTINLPPTNNSVVIITNDISKTVTIDATTALSNGLNNCLTITNLNIGSPFPGTSTVVNTLLLRDPGTSTPLRIANTLTITAGGVLQISNGAVQVANAGGATIRMRNDGEVWLHTPQSRLVNTNGNLHVGDTGTGLMTVSNGTVLGEDVIIGNSIGANGTLTIAGGTNLANSTFTVGNSTGTVWITGGRLVVSNSFITLLNVGNGGVGRMALSNGTVSAQEMRVGGFTGGRGTLTVAGGTNSVSYIFELGYDTNTTAAVWLTGGQITVPNATTIIGISGAGQMTVSNNGVFLGNTMRLGTNLTANGSLTVAGGIAAMTGPLEIGAGGTGTVSVLSGGLLAVTSTPATVTSGAGFLIDGSVTVSNLGSIIIDNASGIVVGNRGGGTLTMKGGSLSTIFGNLTAGFTAGANGAIWVDGNSSINMTNPGSTIFLGTQGTGQMTISNGTVNTTFAVVGNVAPGVGTLTIAGGTMLAPDGFDVGESAGSTGAVWMTGGTLLSTNPNQIVGLSGVGQMTVSNGTVQFGRFLIATGNIGTFTIAGGTNSVSSELHVGSSHTGTLWLTSGRFVTTNATQANVGRFGVGRMIVSNGTWLAKVAAVAPNTGSQGTLTVAGGSSSVNSNMTVGRYACDSLAIVNVNAGTLAVTNAVGTAVLDVRGGTLTVNGGVLSANFLYVTNACARLIQTGGLIITSGGLILPSDLDADGDGIPNGWESSYGFNRLDPSDANTDPDGDGFSNLQEYLAGTDPTNSASAFRITSITQVNGTNIFITWTTGIGKTNALEKVSGGMGEYTNNFSTLFIATNTTSTTTNYLDVGAIGINPARYYRVRLVP